MATAQRPRGNLHGPAYRPLHHNRRRRRNQIITVLALLRTSLFWLYYAPDIRVPRANDPSRRRSRDETRRSCTHFVDDRLQRGRREPRPPPHRTPLASLPLRLVRRRLP